MKFFPFLIFLILFFPGFSQSATTDFTIKLDLVDDAMPPTTPSLLSVTPIAQTQIDIDWSVSTDNYLVGGYVLLRDGSPIATTTLTNYSDTGLTASTTYSYTVYAFDSRYNLSSTSNALATTTFPAPVSPAIVASTTNQSQATYALILKKIEITTQENSANLSWQTNLPSRYLIRWGRTDSYNAGYITNETYLSSHQTTISDLEPGTVYQYEILGQSPAGIEIVLKSGQFKTQAKSQSLAVENVSRLEASVVDTDVRLSWRLPLALDNTAAIRIVRSHLGFPTDVYDGAVIYDGLSTEYFDQDALAKNSPQYYTVFVIGTDGTVSSGAVVAAYKPPLLDSSDGEVATTTTVPIELTPDRPVFGLDVNEIKLKQISNTYTFLSDVISLSHLDPFTISIPYDALPKTLKSIIVTLLDPTDHRRSYSFLLRINKEGTAYEATLAPLNVIGTSKLQIEIFDFERKLVGKYSRQVDFISTLKAEEKPVVFPDAFINSWPEMPRFFLWIAILFALSLAFIWWGLRRRKNK